MIILLRALQCDNMFTALNGLRATEVAKARDVCRGVHYLFILTVSQYNNTLPTYAYIVCDRRFYSSVSQEVWTKSNDRVQRKRIGIFRRRVRSLNSLQPVRIRAESLIYSR